MLVKGCFWAGDFEVGSGPSRVGSPCPTLTLEHQAEPSVVFHNDPIMRTLVGKVGIGVKTDPAASSLRT